VFYGISTTYDTLSKSSRGYQQGCQNLRPTKAIMTAKTLLVLLTDKERCQKISADQVRRKVAIAA